MSQASSVSRGKLSAAQWIILALVLAADVLDLMDSTIGNIAAPSIVAELGGGEGLIKWLGAGYALAMGALLVLGGRLGDRFGKRRMFLVGLAGFTLASAFCGLAVNPEMIIFSRVLQGAFGALLLPQGLSILMSSLSREQLPTAFSAFGPTMGLSAVLGPIAAGFLISANLGGLNWRPVFLINLVLGAAAFAAALKLLPRDEPSRTEPLDLPGTVILGVSLLLLFYGLIEGPLQSVAAMAAVVGGLIALAGFILRQILARNPLIKMSLFQNRGFTAGLLIGLGFFAAVNGFSYVVGLFFQMVLKLTPAAASLAMAPLLVGIIVMSLVGRPLIARWGRNLVLAGMLTTLAGAGLLTLTVLVSIEPLAFAPALFIIGCGMGACFGSIFDVALGKVAPEESGSASGTLSAVQQLANAVGSAVVTGIYFNQVAAGGNAALQATVLVMGGLVAVCLVLVPLLPPKAQEEGHA